MAVIIAITNQKGGVGKTTTAVNLAYYLGKSGKRVLLVDFDPQGNATSGLGIDKQSLQLSMKDVVLGSTDLKSVIITLKYPNFQIAPATPILADAEAKLAQLDRRFSRLRDALAPIQSDYDIIIVDSPPSLSLLTVNSLVAANYVLLPVQVEFYALEGLGQLLESMKLVRKAMNPSLDLLGVLPTMVDSRTSLSGQVHEEIKKHFAAKVFQSIIPRNVRLAEAPSHGLPVGVYDKFSKGARAYKLLAKEVINRVGL